MWVYKDHEAEEKERPVCRSVVVQDKIQQLEQALEGAIETYEYYAIDKELKHCAGHDIDAKLRHTAEVLHKKLEHELKIETFLKKNQHHENYKDIRKDIQKLENMLREAEEGHIDLD